MSFKPAAIVFLKKALGEDGFESLQKFELWKKKTNTTLDPEEIKIALQIVPRTVLAMLRNELGSMGEGDNKRIKLPAEDAFLQITKFANDVYSGEIDQKGKVIASFKNRSLPGVGLHIMTAFELYDIEDMEAASPMPDIGKQIQDVVDQKLQMRDLISKIVDQKLSEREAVEQMIKTRLTQALKTEEQPEVLVDMKKKDSKLKQFLEKKKNKQEYQISMEKSESVSCPDCGKKIFVEGAFSGCICFGEDRNKQIHIRKTEDGFAMRFSRAWDLENVQMLLDTFKARNSRRS